MLSSPRLDFRRFKPDDLDLLHQSIYSHPQVAATLSPSGELTIRNTEYILYRRLKHWHEHGFGAWALLYRDNQALVGHCGLHYLDDYPEVELTYTIHPDYWGQGLATEAAHIVLHWGFEMLQLTQIVAVSGPDNHASQRVLQKLGMQYEKQIRYNGTQVNYYRLTRSQYLKILDQPMNRKSAN